MLRKSQIVNYALASLMAVGSWITVEAQARAATVSGNSQAQQALARAEQEGKYAFLLFYKQADNATKAMAKTLKEGLADQSAQAIVAYAQVGDPAEQAIVEKFNVARAPMPLTVAVAPNGAMTGVFAQKLTAENLKDAFVTPTMMFTMKSLQEGKLVLVSVQGSAKASSPVAIRDFRADPHFKDRIVTTSMRAADPQEAKFVGQMQLDPRARGTHTVLIAPPGVLVGKFDASTSKDEIAAALAKAGKCCEDPNCKHQQ